MPPRPLSHVARGSKPTAHPDALGINPDLATLAMTVIAYGSATDAYWSYILVGLLGAKAKVGLAMYNALSGAEGKRATILGAAQAKLSANDNRLLQAVYTATAAAREKRNSFSHDLWGFAYPLDRVFVLMNPKDATQHRAKLTATMRRAMSQIRKGTPLPYEELMAVMDPDPTKALVYGQNELFEAVREAKDANRTVRELMDYLDGRADRSRRDSMRRALLSRPLVQQAHQKLLKHNTPKVLRRRRARTQRRSG